jgi:hypothetical protein
MSRFRVAGTWIFILMANPQSVMASVWLFPLMYCAKNVHRIIQHNGPVKVKIQLSVANKIFY